MSKKLPKNVLGETIGWLGMFFLLLSSIVFFVFIVEYDPVGKSLKKEGTYTSVSIQKVGNEWIGYSKEQQIGQELRLLRSEHLYTPENGDTLYGYGDFGQNTFIAEQSLPHAPRDLSDFPIILVFFVISFLCLHQGPEVLYVSLFGND